MKRPMFATLGVSMGVLLVAGCKSELAEQPPTPAVLPSAPATQPDQAAVKRTEEKLAYPVPQVQFDNVELHHVFDFLRDMSQTTIDVDWDEIKRACISRDAPVSTRLRNVKLSKILKTVLATASGGKQPLDMLDYSIADDGVIRVTTHRKLFATTAVTRRYPLDDLLVQPRRPGDVDPATVDDLKQQIRELIMDVVAVDQWAASPDAKPGAEAIGTIGYDGNTLVVYHSADVHRQIAGVLAKLRERVKSPQQRPTPTTRP